MQFKKYSEIPEKHRFDLEVLLEGKTIEENFAEIVQISQKLIQMKDATIW